MPSICSGSSWQYRHKVMESAHACRMTSELNVGLQAAGNLLAASCAIALNIILPECCQVHPQAAATAYTALAAAR